MKAVYQNEGVRVKSLPTCYLCGRPGQILFTALRDRLFSAPGTWTLRYCSRDRLAWLDPRPIAEDIGKLYAEYVTHAAPQEPVGRWSHLLGSIRNSILVGAFGYHFEDVNLALQWVASRIPPLRDAVGGSVMWLRASDGARLLDIGCGGGHFLARMRDLGWKVVGVEPDEAAVKVARDHFGLDARCATLETAGFEDASFDAVTMHHVIEHMADPIELLRESNRVLKVGGKLVVVTPNMESLGRRWFGKAWLHWDPPRHLLLFSPQSLRRCVEQAGLCVQDVRTTAHWAEYTWWTSCLIRRDGYLPNGGSTPPSRSLVLQALAYKLLMAGVCRLGDCGEEIILPARKLSTRGQ